MSIVPERYLIRIHARWYPAGVRFVVRCGRMDDEAEVVPMLTPDGWKPITDEMRKTPTDAWTSLYGSLHHVDIRFPSVLNRLTPLGGVIVRNVFERAMMEPRLWEGVVYDEVLSEDPRVLEELFG